MGTGEEWLKARDFAFQQKGAVMSQKRSSPPIAAVFAIAGSRWGNQRLWGRLSVNAVEPTSVEICIERALLLKNELRKAIARTPLYVKALHPIL
jgi:hypothetical protein